MNVHTGVMVTDQGIIAAETVRPGRGSLSYWPTSWSRYVPLGEQDIRDAAKAAVHRGLADALIVTGPFTGEEADMSDVRAVKEAVPEGTPVRRERGDGREYRGLHGMGGPGRA